MKKRILAMILVLCLCAALLPTVALADGGVAISEENFPDAIFRELVGKRYDKNSDGVLSDAEIKNVGYLDISNYDIASLKGVEFFSRLSVLVCYKTKLTSLDLSALSELKTLDCKGLGLTSLDVSKNPKLKSLICSNNALTVLDLRSNPELQSLNCKGNKLTALDVSVPPLLYKLDCSNNELTELDVSKNTLLSSLFFSGNKLTELNVSGNTELKFLECADNALRSIDVSKNPNLVSITCYNNQLTALDLSGHSALNADWCEVSPQLVGIPAHLNGFDLGALIGAENLSRVKSVKGGSISGGILSCSGTKLSYTYDTKSAVGSMEVQLKEDIPVDIAVDAAHFPDETFREYVRTSFDTDRSGSLSPAECAAVTEINVSMKGIASLKGIENFQKLVSLNCFHNALTALDLSENTALTELNCGANALTALDLSRNTKLVSLTCDNNQLTALDLSRNPSLSTLFCSYNKLSALDVKGNHALKTLYCNNNAIRELDLNSNTALRVVYCQDNGLAKLAIGENTAVEELYCFNNKLTALDLSMNSRLRKLSCHNNALAKLDLSGCLAGESFTHSPQTIYVTVPLDGFDLAALVGRDDLSRIRVCTAAFDENGIVSCKDNAFIYTYDTHSLSSHMEVKVVYDKLAAFTDMVPAEHWAYESIKYVVQRNIMSGMSSTTFEPDGTVTRAMIAVMLYNLSGEPEVEGENPFSDVADTDWYALPIIWAYEHGIVSGHEDGSFDPNGKITREQLAVMMNNYYAYKWWGAFADFDLSVFADADAISPWAVPAVRWACAFGIVNGSSDGGKLYMDPQGNATRAQIAVIFHNFCETFAM